MDIQFEGMEELTSQLQSMADGSKKAEEEALLAGAEVAQKGVEEKAPVRAVNGGTLKANIEISDVENGEIEVFVDNQGVAYYGYMQEMGTSKMPARPFMGPAFMRDKLKIEQAMASSLCKSMRLMP